MLEAITNIETGNKYSFLVPSGGMGYPVFEAVELSNLLCKCFCGKRRGFEMPFYDVQTGREAMRLVRPFKCQLCCTALCVFEEIEVQSPPGRPIGTIREQFNPCVPSYMVCDQYDTPVYQLTGPVLGISCWGRAEYPIKDFVTGEQVGFITKEFSGIAGEFLTDADNFAIQFPDGADVNLKATLLGACILIDFMWFEENTARDQSNASFF